MTDCLVYFSRVTFLPYVSLFHVPLSTKMVHFRAVFTTEHYYKKPKLKVTPASQ